MKNMEQISIQNLKVNNVTNSIAEYDSNFIVLLPRTIITEDVLKVFQQTHLNAIITEEPLSIKNSIADIIIEEDIQSSHDETTNTSETNKENSNANISALTDDYQFLEQDDPYVIAHTFTEYEKLYETAYSLLFNFYKTGNLKYQDIQQFVCNEVVPKVKQCPYPYLAIGNMPTDSSRDTFSELAFKNLLVTLVVLEQDNQMQPFFRSIDKRIEIAICTFLSYVYALNIEKQINKKVDFTEYKAREILIKTSAKTLYKKHFPSYVIDVVSHMRPYNSQAQTLQYKETNREITIIANFLTIVDYYVQSITLKKQTPFQTIKTIIDDRYNFSTDNIKIFTKSIGIIPIGSHVKLRNECHAIIRRFSSHNSQMPEVHLVTNSAGMPQNSLVHMTTEKHDFNITEIPSYDIGVQMKNMYLEMLKAKYQTHT